MLFQWLNLLIPQVGTVVTIIRNANGTHDIVFYVDSTAANVKNNLQELSDYMKAHGLTPTPPAP